MFLYMCWMENWILSSVLTIFFPLRCCCKSDLGYPWEGNQAGCQWLLPAPPCQRQVSILCERIFLEMGNMYLLFLKVVYLKHVSLLTERGWQCSKRCWQAVVQACARSLLLPPWKCSRYNYRMQADLVRSMQSPF